MMKIEVLGPAKSIGRGKAIGQPIAVFYKDRRYPSEDTMFIDKDLDEVPVGVYYVDLDELAYPDSKNYGRLALGGIRPKHLKKPKAAAA